MSSFKCSTVLGTSADISGNVRKSSESRRKFSEVVGTFPEIPVLTKSHTFDAEKVGQYRVRVISALTQTHITVKERDLLHFLLFWTLKYGTDGKKIHLLTFQDRKLQNERILF